MDYSAGFAKQFLKLRRESSLFPDILSHTANRWDEIYKNRADIGISPKNYGLGTETVGTN
jgi:hypothetical protein